MPASSPPARASPPRALECPRHCSFLVSLHQKSLMDGCMHGQTDGRETGVNSQEENFDKVVYIYRVVIYMPALYLYIYIYKYIVHIYEHTHTHIYIYIYAVTNIICIVCHFIREQVSVNQYLT